MPKFFINNSQIQNNQIQIKGQDVNHIKNVLRAKVGDILQICNKDTSENYICEIINISNQEIKTIIKQKEQKLETEPRIQVTIFQGLPKADKMEYIIQKSVELGVYDITPVELKRCIVKLQEKDKTKKIQRWQKISEVAAKQSGRNIVPKINKIINLEQIKKDIENFDMFFVAYENEKENKIKQELKKLKELENKKLKIGVLIGPEGGLEEKEVDILKEKGAKIISLGNRILRTETVALNILSILIYEFEE